MNQSTFFLIEADLFLVLFALFTVFCLCLGIRYVCGTCSGTHVVRLCSCCGELAMVTMYVVSQSTVPLTSLMINPGIYPGGIHF